MSSMDGHSDQMQPSDVTAQLDAAVSSQAAVEYRQVADEHVKTLKDFWKDFLVSGIFILAAIVIIFACLAWFAANNRVGATGSGISAKGPRFTLESYVGTGETGSAGAYENDIVPNPETEATASDSTETTADGTSLLVTPSSNLNNTDGTDSLHPGARGQISFTVTPLVTNLGKIEIDISRVIKTARGADGETLLNLLSGHLLMFQSCDNGYYAQRIKNGQFEIASKEFEDMKPVTKTIYWVWPEYFQNYVLTGNVGYYKNLFASVGDDYNQLIADMNKTPTTEDPSHYYFGTVDGQSFVKVSSQMSSNEIETAAELYNNADEYLGNNVKYLQLKISANEA